MENGILNSEFRRCLRAFLARVSETKSLPPRGRWRGAPDEGNDKELL